MKKMPEELTAELLSLVLDKLIPSVMSSIQDNQLYYLDKRAHTNFINIDTLTKLMLDFIVKQGLIVEMWEYDKTIYIKLLNYKKSISLEDGIVYSEEANRSDRNEAIIKATHWAAKEKGLLK